MLSLILGFVASWLPSIGKTLVDGYKVKVDGENTKARIDADLVSRKLELDAREADINAQTVRMEQGNVITRWVRPVWTLPFVAYTWKIVVWDKMLGFYTEGSTPSLGPTMDWLMTVIVIAYFGGRTLEKLKRK